MKFLFELFLVIFFKLLEGVFFLIDKNRKNKRVLKRVSFQVIGISPLFSANCDLSTFRKLKNYCSDVPQENEDKIVQYLKEGYFLKKAMGSWRTDRFCLNKASGGGLAHTLTDGTWAWSGELAYYVKTYHVKIPDEFVDHMEANRWELPPKETIDFEKIHGYRNSDDRVYP